MEYLPHWFIKSRKLGSKIEVANHARYLMNKGWQKGLLARFPGNTDDQCAQRSSRAEQQVAEEGSFL